MLFTAMASSFGCMTVFYTIKKIWKTLRYTKPRHRGIDPVGEAEVFLAYGRTKDAVRVLRDTLQDEPDNLAAKLTLLHAYSSDRNVRAYSTLALDVHSRLQDQALWNTIQRNGRDMDPHNPLFNT
jgi:pilus assembly protein FimV